MSKKQKNQDEMKVVKKFDYTLRTVTLNFALTTLQEMKDFEKLLIKGLEDLRKVIAEYEQK